MILTPKHFNKFQYKIDLNHFIRKDLTGTVILLHEKGVTSDSFSVNRATLNNNYRLVKYLLEEGVSTDNYDLKLASGPIKKLIAKHLKERAEKHAHNQT